LNPSVISVGKITWRHHAVAYFQTNCILRRQNRRYIPTDLETELFPSVIPLLFSGFLVVSENSEWGPAGHKKRERSLEKREK
jgi:hypothetical protein